MGQNIEIASLRTIIDDLQRRVYALEHAPRLTNASLRRGTFSVIDDDLDPLVQLGVLAGGGIGLDIAAGRITVEGATVDAISASVDYMSVTNTSLDTTEASKATNTLTKPSWATRALVFAVAGLQVSNGSGDRQTFFLRAGINGTGTPGAGRTLSFPTSYTHSVHDQTAEIVTGGSLGSTITNHAVVWMPSGANTTNIVWLTSIALWMRA